MKNSINNDTDLKQINAINESEDDDVVNSTADVTTMHKFQFILRKQKSVVDLLNDFDMHLTQFFAYNGIQLYMTQKSYFAYKYMVKCIITKYQV